MSTYKSGIFTNCEKKRNRVEKVVEACDKLLIQITVKRAFEENEAEYLRTVSNWSSRTIQIRNRTNETIAFSIKGARVFQCLPLQVIHSI